MAACKKLWVDADRDRAKAELCVSCATDIDKLVSALHAFELDRIDGFGPNLPPHRRQALEAAATEAADGWRATLATMRAQLDVHRTGGPLLLALARDALATCEAQGTRSPRRYSSADSHSRGVSHEKHAVLWAKTKWPQHEVLSSCVVLPSSSGVARLRPGVKGEFDAMVVRRDPTAWAAGGEAGGGDKAVGWLVAIVEAKANPNDCFKDVKKMVEARDELMALDDVLTVRYGGGDKRTAPLRHVRVPPAAVPHVAYVLGAPATSLGQVLERAVASTLRHVLLDKTVEAAAAAGDAGAPLEVLPKPQAHAGGAHERAGIGAMRVTFSAAHVAEQQAVVGAFEQLVRRLLARGEVSFWARA